MDRGNWSWQDEISKIIFHLVEQEVLYTLVNNFEPSHFLQTDNEICINSYFELSKTNPILEHVFIDKWNFSTTKMIKLVLFFLYKQP